MKEKVRDLMNEYAPQTKKLSLGVSIYPEHSEFEKDCAYLKKAASLGYSRVFTCLLSAEESKEEIIKKFTKINKVAVDLGMEVIFDVNPLVFAKLGVRDNNLEIFKSMHASGIRLDMGMGLASDVALTQNEQGLLIEVNASMPPEYIARLKEAGANMEQVITCHNFYPQEYTGLSFDLFKRNSKAIKQHGLKVAAFVTSQEENTLGPWPVNEGLPTLEEHRHLPIDLQARHLLATGLVDDIIIGNAYANDEELKALSKVLSNYIEVKIAPSHDLTSLENNILMEKYHFIRPDTGEFVYRSSATRFIYGNEDIPSHHTKRQLRRGDIILINNTMPHYRGELQLVLQDRHNDGRANVIARVEEDYLRILDLVSPGSFIKFIK